MTEGNTATTGNTGIGPFNPEDQAMTRSFFEKIADTVVQASELAKVVEQMRSELDALRASIEQVRSDNARMDAEIYDLRSQRDSLRQECAEKGTRIGQLSLENENLSRKNESLAERLQEAEMSISALGEEVIALRLSRDNAEYRSVELDDTLRHVEEDRQGWKEKAEGCESKLATLKSIFTN